MRLFRVMDTAYEAFDNTVRTYLSKTFNVLGISGMYSQVYSILYEGIRGIMQNIMFYIEDALTEQNIFTASRKISVYSLAKMSGYEPYYGSASSGTIIGTVVRGSALESDATKIFIPNNTTLVNKVTNKKYLVKLSTNEYVVDLTKPLISHEFKVVEGTNRLAIFSATGKQLETFAVQTKFALFDKNYVEILVNGEKWTQAASLYDMGENEKSYILTVGYDGSFEVMFGDSIYGQKLDPGDNVTIKWLAHNGESGNVFTNANTNFVFYTGGRDTYGNTIDLNKYVKLSMNNCIAGGTNPDDIKAIRSMIGYNSRSMILATDENFIQFFKRFSFIGRVNCWSHESTMKVIAVCTSNLIDDVKNANEYFALNLNDLYLSKEYKDQIITALTLSNRTFAGISIEFHDPIFVRYAAVCIIKVKDSYNVESVKLQIKEFLGDYFRNLPEGVQKIYRADIIQKVMNSISDIESFDIQFISERSEIAWYNKFYTKTTIEFVGGALIPKTQRIVAEEGGITPGLDQYGNIELYSKLEIPLLQGGFDYFDRDDSIGQTKSRIDTIQYILM